MSALITVGLTLLAGCANGSLSSPAGTDSPNREVAVTAVYRSSCNADGRSKGLDIGVRISDHKSDLLSAGIDSSSDSAPLVTPDFRPSNDSWDATLVFNPLGGLDATLAAGQVDATLGVSDTNKKSTLGSTLRIVIPPAKPSTCR